MSSTAVYPRAFNTEKEKYDTSVKTHKSIESRINITNIKYALYDSNKQRKAKIEEHFQNHHC